jgi:DNA-binding Lrp family transcriptional regulator
MLAYVFIQTAPGKFNGVYDRLKNRTYLLLADVVFGPADILAKIRGPNFDEIVASVLDIRNIDGVIKTATSPVIDKEPETLENERVSAYAYILASASPKSGLTPLQAFKNQKLGTASVTNCHFVLGEYDYVLEVQSRSLSDLKKLIRQIHDTVTEVTSTSTLITSPP